MNTSILSPLLGSSSLSTDGFVKKAPFSTNNAIVRFDGVTGDTVKNSALTLSDDGRISGLPSSPISNDEAVSKEYVDTVASPLTAGNGINISSNVISADINTNNLKFTSSKIDTIQNISPTDDVTFNNQNLTGDLTVDTNILKVDSTNDRVGVLQDTPLESFHLGNGNIAAVGSFGSGDILSVDSTVAGSFSRMIWYGRKAAFRVGGCLTEQWDDANIGDYSFATGINSGASGDSSFSSGSFCNSNGDNSYSLGSSCVANGSNSFALGNGSQALDNNSFVFSGETPTISDGVNTAKFGVSQFTVTGNIAASNFSGSSSGVNTGDETQSTIRSKLGVASASQDGYLTSGDWNTFNDKSDPLTAGDGIDISSNVISADINTNNLKFTSGQINVIQDISTSSSPSFVNGSYDGTLSVGLNPPSTGIRGLSLGVGCSTNGNDNFSGGQQATNNANVSFLWNSSEVSQTATIDNAFIIHTQNGVGINTNNPDPSFALDINGDMAANNAAFSEHIIVGSSAAFQAGSAAIGTLCGATEINSISMGENATSSNENSFIWSDGQSASTSQDQTFCIYATNGVGINKNNNNPGTALDVNGNIAANNFSGSSSGTNTGDQTIVLTGDITGGGTGSIFTTLATVNSNTGTFGSQASIPTITVNEKGLITAVGANTILADAGNLEGNTLDSGVVNSSLTSVGTLTNLDVADSLTIGGNTISGTNTGDVAPFCATGSGTNITSGILLTRIMTLSVIQVANPTYYSPAINNVTVLQNGTYQVSFSIQIQEDSTAGGVRGRATAAISVNNTNIIEQSYISDYVREQSGGAGLSNSFNVNLSASDTLRVVCSQDGVGEVDISAERIQLSITKLI